MPTNKLHKSTRMEAPQADLGANKKPGPDAQLCDRYTLISVRPSRGRRLEPTNFVAMLAKARKLLRWNRPHAGGTLHTGETLHAAGALHSGAETLQTDCITPSDEPTMRLVLLAR